GVADARFEAQPVPLREGVEVRHHLEARLAIRIIDAGEIHQHVEARAWIVPEESRNGLPRLRMHHGRLVTAPRARFHDRVRNGTLQNIENNLGHGGYSISHPRRGPVSAPRGDPTSP